MTLIRKLAWALCLVFLSTSYSNSQDISTSGNLVNFTNQANSVTSTWQNAGTIGQPLTCWAPGGQGYCGPLPRVAAWGAGTNIINFSYGLTDLNQVVNIKNALPNSGAGLQVNGFNFGFTAKNGNGWDDGRQDYLTAYVNIYNNTNTKILESYNYDVNRRYGWTQFYWSETFKTPYAVPDLGNAQYGLVGKDNNFWVGPYGPEVMNVNFSLKYSVDPCATNPLYSPSCKGYMDALAKLAPAPVSVADATPPPPPPPEDSVPPPPGLPLPPGSSSPTGSPPPGSPPPAGSGPQPANQSQPANQPPPPGGNQPKIGEIKTAGDSKSSSSGPSLVSVLSMISSNQARIGSEAKSVVQAAESAAAKDAQQAQQQAEAVANTAVMQSTASGTTGTTATTSSTAKTSTQTQTASLAMSAGSTSTASSIEAIRPPAQAAAVESTASTGTGLTMASIPYQYSSFSTQSSSVVSAVESPLLNFGFQLPSGRAPAQTEPEAVPQFEGIKIGSRSTLNDAMEQRTMLSSSNTQEQKTDSVNRNVQTNELAGSVDLRTMATQPQGYQAYFGAMPDVAFYAPKEIYKNQVNVDNVRLLRGLGSDRLHQEMVNQQYKIGN